MKLSQLKLPYQIQIDDIIGRSGFVTGTQGVTEIKLDKGMAVIKREGKPDLVFAGQMYGVVE